MTHPSKKTGCSRNMLLILGAGLVLVIALILWSPSPSTQVATQPTAIPPTDAPEPTNAPPTAVPAPAPTALPRGYVSKATFAGDWPLTIEAGFLDCLRPQQVYFLSLDRQRVWAVNLPARSQIEEKGWSDVEDIRKPGADLFPLIQEGLKLCP